MLYNVIKGRGGKKFQIFALYNMCTLPNVRPFKKSSRLTSFSFDIKTLTVELFTTSPGREFQHLTHLFAKENFRISDLHFFNSNLKLYHLVTSSLGNHLKKSSNSRSISYNIYYR